MGFDQNIVFVQICLEPWLHLIQRTWMARGATSIMTCPCFSNMQPSSTLTMTVSSTHGRHTEVLLSLHFVYCLLMIAITNRQCYANLIFLCAFICFHFLLLFYFLFSLIIIKLSLFSICFVILKTCIRIRENKKKVVLSYINIWK